tara:strand:+ start:1005 stop:1520 length:516 start_codon:yes stop_codon:yes gene_type:complete
MAIKIVEGDKANITKPKTDALVSPANGVGVMGAGAAGAIADAGGQNFRREAKDKVDAHGKPLEPGECYSTEPHRLKRRGVKRVYHAVTMKYPGGFTSLDIVDKVMHTVLNQAIEDKMESIAFPGLGTGIGGLEASSVARIMMGIAKNYTHLIDIRFVDINPRMVGEWNKRL